MSSETIENLKTMIAENDNPKILFDKVEALSKEDSHPDTVFAVAESIMNTELNPEFVKIFVQEKMKKLAEKLKGEYEILIKEKCHFATKMKTIALLARMSHNNQMRMYNVDVLSIFKTVFADHSQDFENALTKNEALFSD